MDKNTRTHTADLLFTIGLFCVFAAAAFILVCIGVQAYRNTARHMQDTFSPPCPTWRKSCASTTCPAARRWAR